MIKTYDAVIIGAGLAGLQCAKLLAEKGVKVLLVDRKSDLAKGVHTTGIFVRKTFSFPKAHSAARSKTSRFIRQN